MIKRTATPSVELFTKIRSHRKRQQNGSAEQNKRCFNVPMVQCSNVQMLN